MVRYFSIANHFFTFILFSPRKDIYVFVLHVTLLFTVFCISLNLVISRMSGCNCTFQPF